MRRTRPAEPNSKGHSAMNNVVSPLSVTGRIRGLVNSNPPAKSPSNGSTSSSSKRRGIFGIQLRKTSSSKKDHPAQFPQSSSVHPPPHLSSIIIMSHKTKDSRSVTFALDNPDENENPEDENIVVTTEKQQQQQQQQSTPAPKSPSMQSIEAAEEEEEETRSNVSTSSDALGQIDQKIHKLMNHLSRLEPPQGASSFETEEFQQLMGIASSAWSYSVARKKERPSYSGIIGARRRIEDERGMDTRTSLGDTTITTLEPILSSSQPAGYDTPEFSYEDESLSMGSRSSGGRRRTNWEETSFQNNTVDEGGEGESRDDDDDAIANSQEHDMKHSHKRPLPQKKMVGIARSERDTAPRFAKGKSSLSSKPHQGRNLRSQAYESNLISTYSECSVTSEDRLTWATNDKVGPDDETEDESRGDDVATDLSIAKSQDHDMTIPYNPPLQQNQRPIAIARSEKDTAPRFGSKGKSSESTKSSQGRNLRSQAYVSKMTSKHFECNVASEDHRRWSTKDEVGPDDEGDDESRDDDVTTDRSIANSQDHDRKSSYNQPHPQNQRPIAIARSEKDTAPRFGNKGNLSEGVQRGRKLQSQSQVSSSTSDSDSNHFEYNFASGERHKLSANENISNVDEGEEESRDDDVATDRSAANSLEHDMEIACKRSLPRNKIVGITRSEKDTAPRFTNKSNLSEGVKPRQGRNFRSQVMSSSTSDSSHSEYTVASGERHRFSASAGISDIDEGDEESGDDNDIDTDRSVANSLEHGMKSAYKRSLPQKRRPITGIARSEKDTTPRIANKSKLSEGAQARNLQSQSHVSISTHNVKHSEYNVADRHRSECSDRLSTNDNASDEAESKSSQMDYSDDSSSQKASIQPALSQARSTSDTNALFENQDICQSSLPQKQASIFGIAPSEKDTAPRFEYKTELPQQQRRILGVQSDISNATSTAKRSNDHFLSDVIPKSPTYDTAIGRKKDPRFSDSTSHQAPFQSMRSQLRPVSDVDSSFGNPQKNDNHPSKAKKDPILGITRSKKDIIPRFGNIVELSIDAKQQGSIVRSQSDMSNAKSTAKYSDISLMNDVIPRSPTYDAAICRTEGLRLSDNMSQLPSFQSARSQLRHVSGTDSSFGKYQPQYMHSSIGRLLPEKKASTLSIERRRKETVPRFTGTGTAKPSKSEKTQQQERIVRSQSAAPNTTPTAKYSDSHPVGEVLPRSSTYENASRQQSSYLNQADHDDISQQTPEQSARSQVLYAKKISRNMDSLEAKIEPRKERNRVQATGLERQRPDPSTQKGPIEANEMFSEMELKRLKRLWVRSRRRASGQAFSDTDSCQSTSRGAISEQALDETRHAQSSNRYGSTVQDMSSQDTYQSISKDEITEDGQNDFMSVQSGSSDAVSVFMSKLWEQTLSESEAGDSSQLEPNEFKSRSTELSDSVNKNETTPTKRQNKAGKSERESEMQTFLPSSSASSMPLNERVNSLNGVRVHLDSSSESQQTQGLPETKLHKDPLALSFRDFADTWKRTGSPPTKQLLSSIPSLIDGDTESHNDSSDVPLKDDALSKPSISEASYLSDFRSDNYFETLTKEALADANASRTVVEQVLSTKNECQKRLSFGPKENVTNVSPGELGSEMNLLSFPGSERALEGLDCRLSEKNALSFDSSDAGPLRISHVNPANYFPRSFVNSNIFRSGGCGSSYVRRGDDEKSEALQMVQESIHSPKYSTCRDEPSLTKEEIALNSPDCVSIGASAVSSTVSNKARRSGAFSVGSSIESEPTSTEQSVREVHNQTFQHGNEASPPPTTTHRSPWKPKQNPNKPTSSYWQNLPQMSKLGSFDSTLVNEEIDKYSRPNPYVFRDGPIEDCISAQRSVSEDSFFTPQQQQSLYQHVQPPPSMFPIQYHSPPQMRREQPCNGYQSPQPQQQHVYPSQVQQQFPYQHQQTNPPECYTPPQQQLIHANITTSYHPYEHSRHHPVVNVNHGMNMDSSVDQQHPSTVRSAEEEPYEEQPKTTPISVHKSTKSKKKTHVSSSNKSLMDNEEEDQSLDNSSHRHTISFRTEATDEDETFLTEDDRKTSKECSPFFCGDFNLADWIPSFCSH